MHTTETIRIRYFMDLLMEKSWPVMLVGNAGTGKSVLMGDKLDSLSTDDYLVQAVPFNFYTTSAMLQGEVEDEPRCSLPGLDTPGHSCLTCWPPIPLSVAPSLLTTAPGAQQLPLHFPCPPPTGLCPHSGGTRSHRELTASLGWPKVNGTQVSCPPAWEPWCPPLSPSLPGWLESNPPVLGGPQGYPLGRCLWDRPGTVGATPFPSLGVLEKPLEKKSGRNYGPPGTKKLIYFIDDMNMPEVDKYGTVAPHTLIRQHMDHGHW